jgi:alkyl sulfatase BDS1-like metallo-beta-lactamase superfamily hydrolase
MNDKTVSGSADNTAPKSATSHTRDANAAVSNQLPFSDRQSFADASRGFIASIDPVTINREGSRRPVYDLSGLDFLAEDAPDTVNPSLWRQAQLNARHHGLFEVTDGIYQVRSFDIANMTLIRGDSGWIIVDPLTSTEASAAALQLANEHLGQREVVAVLYTHSHVDHFGGALGVVDPDDAASGKVLIVAPEHFVDEALSENVLAGNVMGRRATFMYGNMLPSAPDGFVSTGLGAALSLGSTGFVPPNDTVRETGENRTIDGIEFEFQMTPGTEAPAEFVFYLPQFKALCMSEITSHHLHNVYTLRGAQVRDALAWSNQINESIDLFGQRLDIQFACHHWPIWGREQALEYLKSQRDLYKYIHDQTLRLANHGLNKEEIAEQLDLPPALGHKFHNRGYYGSVHHNVCAVYVKYLGHFDGNPANIHRHPPAAAGARYVEFMGGADAVIDKARESFDAGDYRWVAEVLNHVVMSEPGNTVARALLADAHEQLGYQAESAVWRNFYLTGALELRRELASETNFKPSLGMVRGIPMPNMFQAMAVRLNGPAAEGLVIRINLNFPDLNERYLLIIENSVLHAFLDRTDDSADATLTMESLDFKKLMTGVSDGASLLQDGKLEVSGDVEALARLTGLFDQFERRFPIVTPRSART